MIEIKLGNPEEVNEPKCHKVKELCQTTPDTRKYCLHNILWTLCWILGTLWHPLKGRWPLRLLILWSQGQRSGSNFSAHEKIFAKFFGNLCLIIFMYNYEGLWIDLFFWYDTYFIMHYIFWIVIMTPFDFDSQKVIGIFIQKNMFKSNQSIMHRSNDWIKLRACTVYFLTHDWKVWVSYSDRNLSVVFVIVVVKLPLTSRWPFFSLSTQIF